VISSLSLSIVNTLRRHGDKDLMRKIVMMLWCWYTYCWCSTFDRLTNLLDEVTLSIVNVNLRVFI
jgi:hypothetical protein